MDGRGLGRRGRDGMTTVVGGDRFRLRIGTSGRRYVFSRVEPALDAGDLDGAVVALTARDRSGAARLVWIGAGERLPAEATAPGHEIQAHWLAETAAERARVIADLGATVGRGAFGGAEALAA